MRPITFHLCFALFSLVAASTYPSDAKDPFTNPTVSSNAPDPNELENHVHSTLEDLHVGCPTDEPYPFHPSNTQFSPPQAGSHTMVVGITVILLVSVVWPVWRCMGDDVQNGHLVHRAGRSDAVSALAPASHEGGLRHHDNSIGSKPHRRLSAAVVSSDVPCHHTPPPLCWTAHPPAPISEEPEDDCAVANPQRSATPRIHALQRVAVAGRHTLRTWSWPPTNRSTRTVVCLCVPPPDPCSLRRPLHKGARDLGDEPLELDRCMIIVVGVDTPNHEDAENDARYLQKMFESSTPNFSVPRYECIYGPNATRVKIREAVRTLIGEAQAMPVPPRMFMWFTGTGDHNNAMCLPNDETLSESDLGDLLFSLADQTNKPVISTLFDICRPAAPRLATILQCVEMAWSCSVGQLACALLLPKQEDKLLPRSTFLLAIFLAAHHTNIHGQDERFFEADFAFHINQLSGYVQFRYHQLHRERCPHCPADKPCDPPVAQNPDLQHAGRAITTLGMLIANHFPEHAYEVFVAVGRRMKEKGFPRRLCPLSDSLATQAVRSSTRGDGSYLDSRTASRAKVRFASVEAEPLPRVV